MADTARSTRTAAEILYTQAAGTINYRSTRTVAEILFTVASATISLRTSRQILEVLYSEIVEFEDTFTAGNGTLLENHDPDNPTDPSQWTSRNGTNQIQDNAYQGQAADPGSPDHIATFEGQGSGGVLDFEHDANSSSSGKTGAIFRYSSNTDFWRATVDNSTGSVELTKFVSGTPTTVGSATIPAYNSTKVSNVRAKFGKTKIEIDIDGIPLQVETTDAHQETAQSHGVTDTVAGQGQIKKVKFKKGGLFFDTFQDSDGVALPSHSPDDDEHGAGWKSQSGTLEIQTDRCVGKLPDVVEPFHIATFTNKLSDGDLNWGFNDQDNSSSTDTCGVVFRYKDNDNHFYCVIKPSDTTISLYRRQGGSNNLLGSETITDYVSDDINLVTITLNDDDINVGINGDPAIITVVDSFQKSKTEHGVRVEAAADLALTSICFPVRLQSNWVPPASSAGQTTVLGTMMYNPNKIGRMRIA